MREGVSKDQKKFRRRRLPVEYPVPEISTQKYPIKYIPVGDLDNLLCLFTYKGIIYIEDCIYEHMYFAPFDNVKNTATF